MAEKNFIIKGAKGSVWAGVLIMVGFVALIPLPNLRGSNTPTFLLFFFLASCGYIYAILRINRDHLPIKFIFGFAIAFRLIFLFTDPSLSDDVYRYIWDGHLLTHGINPYAFPVNSPFLDGLGIPMRSLVNHDWMASPYLPVSQGLFALITFLFPQNILAFQVTVIMFDLFTGWLVLDILCRMGLTEQNVLVYLWNPLVIVEFAQGSHIDALMIALMMLAIWFLVRETQNNQRKSIGSALALSAATLTKFLPILLVPIFFWRWAWLQRGVFVTGLLIALAIFIPGAGLGLTGPLEGTGIFGALKIYLQSWNYNGGIYHWLETWISKYPTPGAVPVEIVGEAPILLTKAITFSLLGGVILLTTWLAWQIEKSVDQSLREQNLALIRLCLLPLGAFLLLTTTVHPWYVTLIVPFLPFLLSKRDESPNLAPLIWPGVYFSIIVVLSYLTYLDPNNLRETNWVRRVEYIPLYCLLILAIWRVLQKARDTGAGF